MTIADRFENRESTTVDLGLAGSAFFNRRDYEFYLLPFFQQNVSIIEAIGSMNEI